jgi:hypothetical protein
MPSNIPTIHNLMDDPLFRAYMKRAPRANHANKTGNAWQLWVNRPTGTWGTTFKATYADVWPVFLHHYRAGDGRDVTIVSRRLFYAPPGEWYRVKVRLPRPTPSGTTHRLEWRWRQLFFWDATDLHWCGRCRRPSYWMPLYENHHALRRSPAYTTEDNTRCIICGIRWIACPSIDQMVKMEAIPK